MDDTLLEAHVERFNAAVRSGDYAPMLAAFAPDAEMAFEGAPAGPFTGRDAIAAAYAAMPPTDEVRLLGPVREEDGATVADYAWAADGVRAGRMLLSARDGLITRLVVTFEPPLLRPLTDADVPVVERLWQLYSHDMSEVRGTLPNQEGLYKPGRLATYLSSPDDVDGYLIWHRDAPAGFAFVSGLSGELRHMGDFFVVRAARRQGVGNVVAAELFARYPGKLGDRLPGQQPRRPGVLAPSRLRCSRNGLAGGAAPRPRQAAHPGRSLHPLHARGELMFANSAHLYDAVYSFKDYRAESERLHALIEERSPGASTLLDVACGTGKHLEQLRAWYEVSGLDLDPQLLALARERLGAVELHEGDMTAFSLGRRFDVVTCLFSSIGYVGTVERLGDAIAAMAAHLNPGGVLIVEPWLTPDEWIADRPHLLSVDEPDLKIARMTLSGRVGRLAIMHFEYLVGTPAGIEAFSERHEAALFTDEEYRQAFVAAGLSVERDSGGPDRPWALHRATRSERVRSALAQLAEDPAGAGCYRVRPYGPRSRPAPARSDRHRSHAQVAGNRLTQT